MVSRLIDANTFKLSLIFCNTKKRVDEVAEYLHIHGYRVKALHGDLKQKERDFVMNLFRKGQLDVLIATDVAARGIDVDDIDAVINFDVPQDEAYYVHRIGRTGRAGREGVSYILATNRQKNKLRFIERLTKTPLIPTKIPSIKEIENKRMHAMFEEVKNHVPNAVMQEMASTYFPQLLEHSEKSVEDLAAILFALLIKERFPNVAEKKNDTLEGGVQAGFERVYLNLGNDHRLSVGGLIRLLASESGISGKNFGSIELGSFYSYVELPERFVEQLLAISEQVDYAGKPLELSKTLIEDWANQTAGRKSDRSFRKERGARTGRETRDFSERAPRQSRAAKESPFSDKPRRRSEDSGDRPERRSSRGGERKGGLIDSFFEKSKTGKEKTSVSSRPKDGAARRLSEKPARGDRKSVV